MSYDLIRHTYYSLEPAQSPLYRFKTQIAERYHFGRNRAIFPNNLKSRQAYFIFIDLTINLRFINSQNINFGVEYKKFETIQMCE